MPTIYCKTFEEFVILALRDESLLTNLIELGDVLTDPQIEIDLNFVVSTKIKVPLKSTVYLEGEANRTKLVSLIVYALRRILQEKEEKFVINDFTICQLKDYKYIQDRGPEYCIKEPRTPECSEDYIFPYLP